MQPWQALFGSIRRIQITLTLAAILPGLAIILQTGFKDREHALQEMHVRATLLSQNMSEYQERIMRDVRQLLAVLAVTPWVREIQEPATSNFLKTILDVNPNLGNIFLVNVKGDFVASARDAGPLNVADRDYFQRAMATGAFTVAGLHLGRVSGLPVLIFAQPIKNRPGQIMGLLGVALRLDGYTQMFKQANFPDQSVLSVVDAKGFRICRYPEMESMHVGAPIPGEIWREISGPNPQGNFSLTGADKVRRVYAFTQHRLNPGDAPYLYIMAGIPEQTGLRRANVILARNLGLLLLVAVLALITTGYLGGLVLGRRIDRLVAVTERVGAGDLSASLGARPGKSELSRLERSVEAMTENLRRNEAARLLAEEALRLSFERLEERVKERTSELLLANGRLKAEMAERVQAEQALRRGEKNYRALYEQAPVGILILDLEGHIQEANPSALRMLDMDMAEIKDLNYQNLIDPQDLAAHGIDRQTLLSGRSVSAQRQFRTSHGESLPVDVVGSLVNGEFYQVIFTDVSQRKHLEDFREDVDRIMRHDLKGPLMGILGMEGLVSRGENLSGKQKAWLDQIRQSGQRMLRMINDSLMLYKMQAKAYVPNLKPVDLVEAARAILREKEPMCRQMELTQTLSLDGAEPGPGQGFVVLAEDVLCHTLLENLIANAVEASPKGARVAVIFDSLGQRLSVLNQGEVPLAIRDQFFEKFVTAGKKYGTGLGTYSAKLIATCFGWDIEVDCAVPGQTTVSVGFART